MLLAESIDINVPDSLADITIQQVVTIVIFIVGIIVLLRRLKKITKPIQDFLTDWFGTEDRPGVKGSPGVMKRLETLEKELLPNHGTSIKDHVSKMHDQMEKQTCYDEDCPTRQATRQGSLF